MRRLAVCMLLGICLLALYGCPYSSVYSLDEEPQWLIQDEYLGHWAVWVNGLYGRKYPVKMIITRAGNKEYGICFTGDLSDLKPYRVAVHDSIHATGHISQIAGKQVMNIAFRGQYFLAECRYENGLLSLLPLSDHFTSKLIRSRQDLHTALDFHFKTRLKPLYDDAFCLYKMTRVQ